MQQLILLVAFTSLMAVSAGVQTVRADTITIMHTDYPPFTYIDKNGESTGFSIDILKAMFKKAEIEMQVKAYPWKRAEKTLSENKNTLVFCARIERREKRYEWIGPVYPRALSLYKLKFRSDIRINSIEDVLRYRIGVVRGYASINELKQIGISESNMDKVSNETINIKKLFKNRFDLIPNNDMVFSYNLRREGHTMNDVEKVFDVTKEGGRDFYFALNKKTKATLVRKLRQAFNRLKTDGTYETIWKGYIHKQ